MNLEPHRAYLHGLAYRITGDRFLAEDLVQDAFVRAVARPPEDTSRPWRPWLSRVVGNLARDALRRRRRRRYVGPWLPTPHPEPVAVDPDPEASAAAAETVGWASLIALEALTPQQRAVWVLREVGELSGDEVAEALGTTASAVRAAHLRARRALARGLREPADLDVAMASALQRLVTAILADDVESLKRVLAADVEMHTDGGGQVHAATRVVEGVDRVARLLLGLARKNGGATTQVRRFNDRMSVVVELPMPKPRFAPTSVMLLTLDAAGQVAGIQTVASPLKLTGRLRGSAPG